jgi:hypothetical protein
MEHQRLFSNRQKRERLKEEFEDRKLAKRLILDGYFFSLHDLRRYKLAFRCCRKASKKCRIRIYISWEELEKAGHYIQGGARVAPEIKGKIDYDLRGTHSTSCIAQNAYLKQVNRVSGLPSLGTAATETGFLVSQIEKNLRMTLDGGMYFCLQRSTVMELSWRRKGTVLLLGSKYSLDCLMKCPRAYVMEHRLKLLNNKKLVMFSVIGEYEKGYCVPGAHIIVELRGIKSMREAMRMLNREIQKCNDEEVKSLDEKFPNWDKMIVYSDKLVAREAVRNLKENVEMCYWDEDWEIQKKLIMLGLEKKSQIDILISVCKTIKKIGKEKGKELYEKLCEQVKKENNENYLKLINFFWENELDKIQERYTKEKTINIPQSCKKFLSMFRKELNKKRGNMEDILNVLRHFELHFRQKLMEKNYKAREKMFRRGRMNRYLQRKQLEEEHAIEIESQDFIEEDIEDSEKDKQNLMEKIRGIDVFVNVI